MTGNKHDTELHALIDGMQYQLYSLKGRPLFTTDCNSDSVFDTYLQGFPEEHRQYHNCRTCREFMNTYGGLVTVDDDGSLVPALWGITRVPSAYHVSVRNVIDMLTQSMYYDAGTINITGVFYSSKKCWGVPITKGAKEWHHLHVEPDSTQIYNVSCTTPFKAIAESIQRYRVVSDTLHRYTLHVLDTAKAMKQVGMIMQLPPGLLWLRQLKADYIAAHSNHKANIIWRAVGTSKRDCDYLVDNRLILLLDSIKAGTYRNVAILHGIPHIPDTITYEVF